MAAAGNLSVVHEEGASPSNEVSSLSISHPKSQTQSCHVTSSTTKPTAVPTTPPATASSIPTETRELDTGKFGKVKVHIQGKCCCFLSRMIHVLVSLLHYTIS